MIYNIIAVAVILLCVTLPISFFLVRDWLRRPTRAQSEENFRQFKQRLQNPDFSALAQYFDHPFPTCVQELYLNKEELLRLNFTVSTSFDVSDGDEWFIAFYEPADGLSVPNPWPGLEKYFAFADDGSGNQYVIDPTQDNPPVLFHYHELSEFSRVCDSFTEFMKWPRCGDNRFSE